MKYLILSESKDLVDMTISAVKNIDKNLKAETFNFDFKKVVKKIDDYGFVILIKSSEILDESISMLTGFICAKDIPVLSNISSLDNAKLLSKKYFYYEDVNDLTSLVKKHYKAFEKAFNQNNNINELFAKGIPFTPDCFSLYISKDKPEICKLFIDGGIDVNSKDDSGIPMINQAVRKDNIELVKQLMDLGADINCVSEDRGYTPVMDAVWRGNLEITELLIKNKAELNTINKEGQSNLVLAVGADRIEITKLLAENGADPDIKDSMGMSAYGYASLFKKQEILDILKPYHKE